MQQAIHIRSSLRSARRAKHRYPWFARKLRSHPFEAADQFPVGDRGVERDPEQALLRLQAIDGRLRALETRAPDERLSVGFSIGIDGAEFQLSPSSLARELNFVASHAIHHYAIIRPLAEAGGLPLPEEFGKAPETVRYERLQSAT